MNTDENLNYFNWLCEQIDGPREVKQYTTLLFKLYKTSFIALVPNDENRISDALDYVNYMIDIRRVSLLEVLIALAKRCEEMLDTRSYKMWFWEMLQNCELHHHENSFYYDSQVQRIINRIINRSYRPDGLGGLFPLKNPLKDQRKVELWYQMAEYINENYNL
jgi:hypothetical protein